MKDYLEKVLHQNINIKQTKQFDNKLPLAFKSRYKIYEVKLNNYSCLALEPKDEIGLVMLRKDCLRVAQLSKQVCILFLKKINSYAKDKLIEEGVPFVQKGKQIYLPFIGIVLSNDNTKEIKPIDKISFLTQKLILIAMYEKWTDVNVTLAAEKLDVSKMSITRCFDEIEYLNIDILKANGKNRAIYIPQDIQRLWSGIKPILRNPVIKRYNLRKDIKLDNLGGISALCEYSLLNDNKYPTYAVTKKEIADIKKDKQAIYKDDIGCVVLELGYFIDYKNKGIQDPLSVYLSLNNEEFLDERVEKSIEEMLKEEVW